MSRLETNIFQITNLEELSSRYSLYQILGIHPEHQEYYRNRQIIKRELSYALENPVTIIDQDDRPYLVVQDEVEKVPTHFPLVRKTVKFEKCPGSFELNYALRTPQNDEICLRFLRFILQAPILANSNLWQPGAGRPFFMKKPAFEGLKILRYEGFIVRPVVTHDGGLGLSVDITNKFIGRRPLPCHLSWDDFSKWRNQHCIYHYGHRWYDIQIRSLSDFNVTEHKVPLNEGFVSLLDQILDDVEKPIPSDLARLPHDAAVIIYQNNKGEERAAPTSLCFPVYSSHDKETKIHHKYTILSPKNRREKINKVVRRYLGNLRFGEMHIRVSRTPVVAPQNRFVVPDLEFGNKQRISLRGTPNTEHIALHELGSTRLEHLQDKNAGFYERDPLDRQYLILPSSVFDSYGGRFRDDLGWEVNRLYQQERGYDPIIFTYNDRVRKTFASQGNAILEAVNEKCKKPGYALIMIHHTTDRNIRDEDQLEAMVARELRQRDIYAAVIHTNTVQACYHLVNRNNGRARYVPKTSKKKELFGYLRAVALNKVLLTNQRSPFVISSDTPMNADIIIGIDVKHNTAGLVIVGAGGAKIRSLVKTSRQKEKLRSDQIKKYVTEILSEELEDCLNTVSSIVIHRDGKTYNSETNGILAAIKHLQNQKMLDQSVELTMLEIPKTSPVPLRLFEVFRNNDRSDRIENPQVGQYYIVNDDEGYLCSTGRVFLRNGTARPLHVRRVYGSMPLVKCLEDIYYLTVLAWTKPEGCVRDPLTVKLNDRLLLEEATDYDLDALEFAE